MFLSKAVATMAKKAGRPSKSEDGDRETRTRPVRAYETDAELLYWIGEVLRKGSAEILQPIIRGPLIDMYDSLKDQIEELKKVRSGEEKIVQESNRQFILHMIQRAETHRRENTPELTLEEVIRDSLTEKTHSVLLPSEAKNVLEYLDVTKTTLDSLVSALKARGWG